MRPIRAAGFTTALVLALAASPVRADDRAEIVSTTKVWDQAPHDTATDLVRFKDRWFVVGRESSDAYAQDGVLRVLTSADGAKWETAAVVKSPTPNRGLYDGKFALAPNDRLMLTGHGIVPNPDATVPLPQFGGTVKSMAWLSKDGRAWDRVEDFGVKDYPFSRVAWHKGAAYNYANGCICGSMQSIQIGKHADDKGFQSLYRHNFSGFFPDDAALVFDGDTAYCLMTRYSSDAGNVRQVGSLGTATAPFTRWEWTDTDTRASHPNLLRLPDKRVIAAVGLFDPKPRTSLGEFDPATGKFRELLELPTGGNRRDVGLAWHDGHVWVSYHTNADGTGVRLAKVKLK